jgi:hypothetical protein
MISLVLWVCFKNRPNLPWVLKQIGARVLAVAFRDWTVLRALQNRSWSSDKALMLEVVQCSWEALAMQ